MGEAGSAVHTCHDITSQLSLTLCFWFLCTEDGWSVSVSFKETEEALYYWYITGCMADFLGNGGVTEP